MTKASDPSGQLTKREYFAAAALAGLVADSVAKKDAASFAVIVADQLIDALNGGAA